MCNPFRDVVSMEGIALRLEVPAASVRAILTAEGAIPPLRWVGPFPLYGSEAVEAVRLKLAERVGAAGV